VEYADLWLIFTRHGIDIEKFPAVKKHLENFKKALKPKPIDWDDKKDGEWKGRKQGPYKWYEIQDNIAYWKEFEQPKILLRAIMDSATFAYDENGYFHNDTLYLIPIDQPYIVGILNSSLGWWFLLKNCPDLQGGFIKAQKEKLFQIPIVSISVSEQKVIGKLATKIANDRFNKETTSDEINNLESRLDALVTHLYNLTEQEYKLILNDLKITEDKKSACLGEFRKIAIDEVE
jgi:hypothetical protein